jgi:glucosamine--fructose-6-phosphate aminotransferase (isomerizing)
MKTFSYDAQIACSPSVVAELISGQELPNLDPSRPILFSGIGTSLHAARVAAEWFTRLSSGAVRPLAIDAHDLGTTAPIRPVDQVVVISHRGYKLFPNASLERARSAGALTIAITGRAAPEQRADHILRTCENETAGTFSVSYLASLTVLARMAASFEADPARPFGRAQALLPDAISRTLSFELPDPVVERLSTTEVLLLFGFGIDLPTAQEAALKIKEGAWMWTEAMAPEFALHGTPASYRPGMGCVLIEPGEDDGGRTAILRRVMKKLGTKIVADCSESPDAELRFVSPHPLLRPFTAILPFHRLTAELARSRGTDPDTLHGHREPWKAVMTALRL